MGVEHLPENSGVIGRNAARVLRHIRWAQRDGLARLVEEDQLDPRERWAAMMAKRRWRRQHAVGPGRSCAVLVVGVQRSGTNMLTRGLEALPEVEVHNENDRRVFERFQLRSTQVLVDTTQASRHRAVIYKPLCDSHRTAELLDELADCTPSPRALWAFRRVDARVRSAVAKFGNVNLRVVQAMLADPHFSGWQAGGLAEQDRATLAGMDPESWDVHTGAAAFWWLRNRLYLTTALDARADVLPVSYEHVVADPSGQLSKVARFLALPVRPELWSHIEARDPRESPELSLHPGVRELCRELETTLESAAQRAQVPSAEGSEGHDLVDRNDGRDLDTKTNDILPEPG